MRLRAEFGELRKIKSEYEQWQAVADEEAASSMADLIENKAVEAASASIPKESWRFAGYDRPESAFESFMWAQKNGDVATFLHSLTPEAQEKAITEFEGKTPDEIANLISNSVSRLKVLRFDRQKVLSASEMGFVLYSTETDDGNIRTREEAVLKFKQFGTEWKSEGF